jgi:hypothetical protein
MARFYASLMAEMDKYIISDPDEQVWPYAGKLIIDQYLDGKFAHYAGTVRQKTRMDFLKDIVKGWKERPDNLTIRLTPLRLSYRAGHHLP